MLPWVFHFPLHICIYNPLNVLSFPLYSLFISHISLLLNPTMGDLETLAKARRELQDLYLGVPDDSVNLSFQELAQVTQRKSAAFSSQLSLQKKSPPAAAETSSKLDKPPSLAKLPSLDFSRALEASSTHRNHNRDSSNITHHFDHPLRNDPMPLHHHHHHNPDHHPQYAHAMNGHAAGHRSSQYGHTGEAHWDDHHGLNGHENHQIHNQQHHVINGHADHHHQIHSHQHHHHASPYGIGASHHTAADRSMGYLDDDMSHMSGMTMAATPNQARRRRPGIPHSNICTVCSTYIYIFRYRCLVIQLINFRLHIHHQNYFFFLV